MSSRFSKKTKKPNRNASLKFKPKKIQAADNFFASLWDFAERNFGRIPILALAVAGFYWFVLHK